MRDTYLIQYHRLWRPHALVGAGVLVCVSQLTQAASAGICGGDMLGTLLILLSSGTANAGWDGSLTAEVSPIDYLTGHLFGVSYEQ